MTQQKKDKVIKGQNPINLLKEQKEKLGIDQYDITLYRKPVGDANYYYLHKWFGTPYSDIVNLEANVKEIFGGGDYLAEIIDSNLQAPPVKYYFKIEGKSKDVPIPQTPQPQPQPQQPPFIYEGQQPQPQQARYDFMPEYYHRASPYLSRIPRPGLDEWQYGMGIPPSMLHRKLDYDRDRGGNSAEVNMWREKYEALQKQIQELKDRQAEEKRRYEIELMQKNHALELQKLQESFEKRIGELVQKLEEGKKPKEDNSKALVELTLSHQKEMNQNMVRMMERDIENQKLFMQKIQEDTKREIELWKSYFDKLEKMNDPSKTMEVLNMIGQQSANWFNLLSDIAQSGLLDRVDNMPAWMGALQQGMGSVKELMEKYFEAKNKEIEIKKRALEKGEYNIPIRQLPTSVESIETKQKPKSKQQPQPKQSKKTEQKPQINMDDKLINFAMNKIYQAIIEKQPPDKVAEMIFVNIDYMLYMGLLPPQMKDLIESEEEIKKFLENVPMDAEYRDKIIEEFVKIVRETKEEKEKEKDNTQTIEQPVEMEQQKKKRGRPPKKKPEQEAGGIENAN